ncbi:MAG: cell division protein FtsW [Ruminococcaceae bacterium]|nr:cell division protein FtsW [Oscillospiraceae bacterium]
MATAKTQRRSYAEEEMTLGEIMKKRLAETFADMRGIAGDRTKRVNAVLMWLVILLLGIGIVSMYSASYAYAYAYKDGNSEYFLQRQLVYAAVGGVMMYLASIYPLERLKRLTPFVYGLSFVLLIIVLFCDPVNGSRRWIPLGPLGTFQPSEVGKLALIMTMSAWASNNYKRMHTFKYGVAIPIAAALFIIAPVLAETHLSCSILMVLLVATILYIGGMSYKWLLPAIGAGVGGIALLFTGVIPYGQSRIAAYKDPFVDALGIGWQNIQALYAISSGGLFGQGIGQSHQKHLYISEPQNDFIFAVVCEEVGFFGALVIIALFVALVVIGFSVSINHSDRFCRLMGVGISAQVGWQTLLNVAVVTKTIPNTGISLPFFSAGGTSLIMLMTEMGILLAISRSSNARRN